MSISSISSFSSQSTAGSGRSKPTVAPIHTSKNSPIYSLRSSSSTVNGSAVSLSSLFAGTAISLPRDAVDDIKSVVHHAFVPHIAVHVSNDVTELVKEKGFNDFTHLLRPYGESIQGRITVRDSQGSSSTIEDFGVRFVDLMGLGGETMMSPSANTPNSASEPRGLFPSSSVSNAKIDAVENLLDLHLSHSEERMDTALASEGDSHRQFYLLYLRSLLSGLSMSNYETFAHPVACLIAISSRNPSPIETLRSLYKSGNEINMPHYVHREYLRYYVLVHDEDKDDIQKSAALFDQMKRHFGLHCHLIRLRSAACVESDDDSVLVPTSQWLSASEELAEIQKQEQEFNEDDERPVRYITGSDETALRTMIREMVAQSVIPFMERNIATWNDQVLSRRKGLSGRVTSFTRRFLGGTASRTVANATSASNYDVGTASYDPSTPEAQMRKLADFAFMLRDWRLAHYVYDILRNDFNNDKAWMHVAGAQEMTVIALLLLGQPISSKTRSEVIDNHLDSACYSFMTRCSAPYSALRCLLVAIELLRLAGGSCTALAAKWAIKAVEIKPKVDVGRALITQRVGDCYGMRVGAGTGAWGGRKRKAAMWHTLAAEQWVGLGKYAQARRCLDDVNAMYAESTWGEIGRFLEQLKVDSGYTTLLDLGDDGEEQKATGEESETLHLGKRKSLLVMPPPEDKLEDGTSDDDFVAS